MVKVLLILAIFCGPAFCADHMVYQFDGNGNATTYLVKKEFGETKVFNLNTGNVGISQKDFMGDTLNITTGTRPDSGMDALLNSGDGESND